MDFKSKPIILVSIVVAVIIGAVSFWYWSKSKQAQEVPTLGSKIFDKTQSPLEGQVPDVNPFKNQRNPLDSLYQNPFK